MTVFARKKEKEKEKGKDSRYTGFDIQMKFVNNITIENPDQVKLIRKEELDYFNSFVNTLDEIGIDYFDNPTEIKIQLHSKVEEQLHSKSEEHKHYIANIFFVLHSKFLRETTVELDELASKILKNADKLKYLEHISLKNCGISKIPQEIYKLSSLKSLNLQGNRIRPIDPGIANLCNLRALVLNYNEIEELPEEIGELNELQHLEIHHNKIQYLPSSFSKLTNLTYMNIGYNSLRELPDDIGDMVKLSSLYLKYNSIKYLPLSIMNGQYILDICDNPISDIFYNPIIEENQHPEVRAWLEKIYEDQELSITKNPVTIYYNEEFDETCSEYLDCNYQIK